ncbi:MAG: type II secretion system protein GspL [Brevundimonas sp.]|jgi:general secretion pathway protein L|uniref:type II secretion system protein GspL n=1 Tax=Brevundimonas sp. TaxID=1871086 RepID=UPI0039198E8A
MSFTSFLVLPDEPEGVVQAYQLIDGRLSEMPSGGSDTALLQGAALIVPGPDVVVHRMALEARTQSQATALARHRIAPELARAGEPCHVAVSPPDETGVRTVAVVSLTALSRWSSWVQGLGFEPGVVVADHMLLSPPDDGQVLAAPIGQRVLLRSHDMSAAVEPELATVLTEGRALVRLDHEHETLRLLADGLGGPLLDLTPPRPRPALGAREVGRTAMLAAAALVMALAVPVAGLISDNAQAERLEAATARLARQSVPASFQSSAPAHERLSGWRSSLGATSRFVDMSASLFALMESVPGTALESLMIEEGGVMRATVAYSDYALSTALMDQAGAHGLVLEEVSALDERGIRVSDYVVRQRP